MNSSVTEDMPGNSKSGAAQSDRVFREDTVHHDPLLDCLVELSRIHGRPSSRAALSAGLPLAKDVLTPSLFARAAARAGLYSKILRRPLDKIATALLPVVLLLDGDEACLLMGCVGAGRKLISF